MNNDFTQGKTVQGELKLGLFVHFINMRRRQWADYLILNRYDNYEAQQQWLFLRYQPTEILYMCIYKTMIMSLQLRTVSLE